MTLSDKNIIVCLSENPCKQNILKIWIRMFFGIRNMFSFFIPAIILHEY
jgi:hypothetical protein